jgi:hypothetical protein
MACDKPTLYARPSVPRAAYPRFTSVDDDRYAFLVSRGKLKKDDVALFMFVRTSSEIPVECETGREIKTDFTP